MPTNLLIFPLIAGFFILTQYKRLKYRQQRLDNQRLLLAAYTCGTIPLLVVVFLRVWLNWAFPSFYQNIYTEFQTIVSNSDLNIPFVGTMGVTFALSIVGVLIQNETLDEKEFIREAIRKNSNSLEVILLDSLDNRVLVQITLKNDKYYIGYVKILPIPHKSNYTNIFPLKSGYRNEKKEVILTTDYTVVYQSYLDKGKTIDIDNHEDINLVIPYEQISSIALYDDEMYDQFAAQKPVDLESY